MRVQSVFEEKLNALSHAFGTVLGVLVLILLINNNQHKTAWSLFSVIVYGLSFILLFMASTVYHTVKTDKLKHYFRIADHISIYFLIAGTYTPVCLIALNESMGWSIFWLVWSIVAFGVILKLFFTGRFEFFSTLLYLVMGWLIVLDFTSLTMSIGGRGINLLILGGLSYTIGIVFYAVDKIPYNHVIWHLFVLAGAIFHFFMILLYII